MIIIFSEPEDVHSLAVQSHILKGHRNEVIILNSADYPTKWRIDFSPASWGEYRIKTGSSSISSLEIGGAWLRRTKSHVLHENITDDEVQKFCYSECLDLFTSFIGSIKRPINTRHAESLALRKAHQLSAAIRNGLQVPDTLISSDPAEIMMFYESSGRDVIFKTMTPTRFQFTETRALKEEHFELLQSSVYAPTIFQKRIKAQMHLRVTVVDDETFCASVETTRPDALDDWRLDHNTIIKCFDLEPSIQLKILSLMRDLGLRYGAIDIILDNNGIYYFLEVNPGGQFLFVEIQTGLPISSAMAAALARGE